MFVTAIVVAAGRGVRLKSSIHKPLVRVGGVAIVIRCLRKLSVCSLIKEIIVVTSRATRKPIEAAIKRSHIYKVRNVVLGGALRQDSVYNGLKAIKAQTSLVLIHDAARPFVDKKIVMGTIKAAQKSGAAIAAVPVKATIKEAVRAACSVQRGQNIVRKTLDRNKLWEAQTPQVFKKEIIAEAYRRFGSKKVTDDAALVERLGIKVSIVMGSYANIKITTPEDLILAERIAALSKK